MSISGKFQGLLPMSPREGPPIPRGMVTALPGKPLDAVRPNWENFKATIAYVKAAPNFKEKFNRFMQGAAPAVPNIDGLPELRRKANEILAPMLFNKWFPPAPAGIAKKLSR